MSNISGPFEGKAMGKGVEENAEIYPVHTTLLCNVLNSAFY